MKWTLHWKVRVPFPLNHLRDLEKIPLVSGMVSSFVKPEVPTEWFPNMVAHHRPLGNDLLPYIKSTHSQPPGICIIQKQSDGLISHASSTSVI